MPGVPIEQVKIHRVCIDGYLDRHVRRVGICVITICAMMPMLLDVGTAGSNTDKISHADSIRRFRPLRQPQGRPEGILTLHDISPHPDRCHEDRENRCHNQCGSSPVRFSTNMGSRGHMFPTSRTGEPTDSRLMACGQPEPRQCRQTGRSGQESCPSAPTGATAKIKMRSVLIIRPTIMPVHHQTPLPDKRKQRTPPATRN